MAQRETSNDGHSSNHRPGIGQRVQEIESSAQHLLDEAKGVMSDLRDTLDLRARVERHPYGTLIAAAAVGYVLGGGLFTSLTGSLVRLGLRLAAVPLVKDELLNLAHSALSGLGITEETQEPQKPQESSGTTG
jgi:hypothetical protein